MSKKTSEKALLAEYNALRNEILSMFNRNNSLMHMTWAGVAILTGISFSQKEPIIEFVAVVLAFWTWNESIRVSNVLAKIGAYIETNLEPKLGLKWEKFRSIEDNIIFEKISFSKIIIGREPSTAFITYLLLCFMVISYNKITVLEIFLIILSAIMIHLGIRRNRQRMYYRQQWIEHFQKLLKEQDEL